MFFAAILTSSWIGDVGVVGTVLGMFATIIKLQLDQKKLQREAKNERREEIKSVLNETIAAQPEKIVVNPQPLIVEMQKEFLLRRDHDEDLSEIRRRVASLEAWRENDRNEISQIRTLISGIPGQVIALLTDAGRLFPRGGASRQ